MNTQQDETVSDIPDPVTATLTSPPSPPSPPDSPPAPPDNPPAGGGPFPEEEEGRPKITVILKRLPEAVAAAQQALQTQNDPPFLFDHGGELVKLVLVEGQAPELMPLRPVDLQCQLTYAARWFEQTDNGTKAVYPPMLVVHGLMQRLVEWALPLREVVRVPTFGKDWRLIQSPGYDPEEQIYYQPDDQPIPPVPAQPEEADVAEARRLICEELLGDFPFVSRAHLAAAVAPMITPFLRDRIDGATPLHLVDSPQPGSGKTLLAEVIAIPSLGREPEANTEIANADDLRKWVTAMTLAGEPVALIDNINARLQGAALAAALTKIGWCDRIVGTSRLAKGAMRCLWLATGNNVTMTAELARRVVRCRIDAGVPQPQLRRGFRHTNVRAWAKCNRPLLIWAILTLVQNWISRGKPEGQIVLGSYESYCLIIGGILQAAGIAGFLANIQADQRHSDDESVEWDAFVGLWRELFGNSVVGAEELDKEMLSQNPELLAITLASAGSQRGRRIKLGQELRKRRDAVIAGCRIKVSDGVDRHGCWHYHLQPIIAHDVRNNVDGG
jgi:hypothetical protein